MAKKKAPLPPVKAKRKSSYQKQKEEIASLYSDIRTLIKNPRTTEGLQVKMRWIMRFGIEDAFMYGTSKYSSPSGSK